MKCHECINQLSAYLDNMLTQEERQEVEQHLAGCSSCQEELEILEAIVHQVNGLKDMPVPTSLHEEIMRRIQEEQNMPQKMVWFRPWMTYVTSTAAILLIVIFFFENPLMMPKTASDTAKAEMMLEAPSEESTLFRDQGIMASEAVKKEAENAVEAVPFAKSESRMVNEALIEEWEITAPDKFKLLEVLRAYVINNEIKAEYLPDELNPESIMLYEFPNRDELYTRLMEITNAVKIEKKEAEGENLKIIIK